MDIQNQIIEAIDCLPENIRAELKKTQKIETNNSMNY